MSAKQIGDNTLIQIADDGCGIRPDVLRRKAVEKGLIDPDVAANLDERDMDQLLTEPVHETRRDLFKLAA